MSTDTEPSTTKKTKMSTDETSADDKLLEKLKIHFNHNDFKSKLQRDAITTILKREHDSNVKFKLI